MDDTISILGDANYEQGFEDLDSKSAEHYPLIEDYTELKPLSAPVSAVRKVTPGTDFCWKGVSPSIQVTIKDTIQDGDSIMLDGVEFIARAKLSKYCKEDEFSISGKPNSQILAERLIGKIFANQKDVSYRYLYDLNQDTITIFSFSQAAQPIAIYTSNDENIEIRQHRYDSAHPAIDLSAIASLNCFIGSVEVEFSRYGSVVCSTGGDNMAATTAAPYVSQPFKEEPDDGDAACLVKMKLITDDAKEIGFIGSLFYSNAVGCLGGQHLKMIETNSKEYFAINWSMASCESIIDEKGYNHKSTNENADLVIDRLNELFYSCQFQQMVYLKLNDKKENIIDEQGKVIASTEGAMAALSYHKTYTKKLQDFQIKQRHDDGSIIFSAKISGVCYMHATPAYNIPNLGYGHRIAMQAKNGSFLAINLGYGGLTCLEDAKYIGQASKAYRALFNYNN